MENFTLGLQEVFVDLERAMLILVILRQPYRTSRIYLAINS
jgi:hypothetical protein